MCGRVACSQASVEYAKQVFAKNATTTTKRTTSTDNKLRKRVKEDEGRSVIVNVNDDSKNMFNYTDRKMSSKGSSSSSSSSTNDNFNLSPGMKSTIFHLQPQRMNLPDQNITTTPTKRDCSSIDNDSPSQKTIIYSEQTWGLVPNSGTKNNPIQPGPSKHFANLMFNARSDTLYDKRTFRELLIHPKINGNGNDKYSHTCIWVIDGYYEWKVPDGDVLNTDKKKQPYYVFRKDGRPLFIPGLWTSVYTGRTMKRSRTNNNNEHHSDEGNEEEEEEETLETFTMLTTDATSCLRWLHHRQPVMIFDEGTAMEWILNPSKQLLKQISAVDDDNGDGKNGDNISSNLLSWHPVTKKMSNVSYRNDDCTKPIKIEKVPSIKSFFSKNTPTGSSSKSSSRTGSRKTSGTSSFIYTTNSKHSQKASPGTHEYKRKKNIFDFATVTKKRTSTDISNVQSPIVKKVKIGEEKDIVDLTHGNDDDDDDSNNEYDLESSFKDQKPKSKASKNEINGIARFFNSLK